MNPSSPEGVVRLEEKAWDYTLEKRMDAFVLMVVCGSVGLYEVEITLSPAQVRQYHQRGLRYLDELAAEIRKSH